MYDTNKLPRHFGNENVARRPEVRTKISTIKKGVPKSEEHKAALSRVAKENAKIKSPKANLKGGMLGKHFSPEIVAEMSQRMKDIRSRVKWTGEGKKMPHPSWNKGQTKETDSRVAAYADKLTGHIVNYYPGGFYEGPKGRIAMRSTWEILYAEFLDKEGYNWQFEKKWFPVGKGPWKGTTYLPDFYVPEIDTYVEIKGEWKNKSADGKFWRNGAKAKVAEFRKRFPEKQLIVIDNAEFAKVERAMGKTIAKLRKELKASGRDYVPKDQLAFPAKANP
jgi:hypothetical protein